MRLDLWELVLHIVRVHCPNLVPGGSAKNFDDLHQLIDSRFAGEKRLPKHQLCHDAPGGPDIYEKCQRHLLRINLDYTVLPIFVV
jgi:hypothetical protein